MFETRRHRARSLRHYGVTILAAERTGRRVAAIELDPLYVDTAIDRWQRVTGKSPLCGGADRGGASSEVKGIRRRSADPVSEASRGGLTMANKAGYASPPERTRWRRAKAATPAASARNQQSSPMI